MDLERCCKILVWYDTINLNLGKFSFASEKEASNIQAQVSNKSILLKASFPWIWCSKCQTRLASTVFWFCAIATHLAEEAMKNAALYLWCGDLF